MLLFTVILSLLLIGCSMTNPGYQKRDAQSYAHSTQIVQYYLPDLPQWVNRSESGQCHRKKMIRYLNLKNLRKSFSFSYDQAVQFQYLFNVKRRDFFGSSKESYLSFNREEKIFFEVSDKIQAYITPFQAPKYKQIHILWIDPALHSEKAEQKMLALFARSSFQKGYPVLASLCLDQEEIHQMIVQWGLQKHAPKVLPFDLLTPYSISNEMTYGFSLYLDQLFREDQNIVLYYPRGNQPIEYKGKFKPQAY